MTTDTSNIAVVIRNISFILLIILPIAALGTRFQFWHFSVGLLLLAGALVASLIIQIINAIWLLRRPASGTKQALRWASLFSLPSLVIVALFLKGTGEVRAPIHNISTDQDNPPKFVAAVQQRGGTSNSLDYTPEVANIQKKAFPEITSSFTDMDATEAFEKSLTVAKNLGWSVYSEDSENGRIEAVDTTFWMGFKDDIVIRITAEDNGSKIDLRSVSRVGLSDLGANAKRIRSFQQSFERH